LFVAAALVTGCKQTTTDDGGVGGNGGAGADGAASEASVAATDTAPPADTAAPTADDAAVDTFTPPIIREEDAAQPSVDAVATTEATQKVLEDLAAPIDGARVVFVDCTAAPCTARVSATTLEGLRAFLVKISDAFHGRTSFVARERFDGFTGHVYEADVVLDTDEPRPVPASEDDLLTDPGT
jgi:hypothetical protein